MLEQTLQTAAIKKSLELSEQDALKVAIFIMGMAAGKDLQPHEKPLKENMKAEQVW